MKRLLQSMLLVGLTIGACSAQCLVIDDFTTGKYKVQFHPINTTATNYSGPVDAATAAVSPCSFVVANR
jgi:hypothetical protein